MWTMDVEFNKKLTEINFDIVNWNDNSQDIKSEYSKIIENIKYQSNSVNEQVKQ